MAFGILEGTGYHSVDKSFQSLVPNQARVERLYSGLRWAEGPAWFAAGRYFIHSDAPNNRMMRWDETDGSWSTFRQPANNSNGNTVDLAGRLVTCEHLTRRITRTNFDGSVTTLADCYKGRRFNSPNDVVVKSDGSIWFTDPDYGITSDYEGLRQEAEQDKCHVFRIDGQTGEVTIVADDFDKPNGLAFSADETRLYISDTGSLLPRSHIRQFQVNGDGKTLGKSKIFAEASIGVFDGFRFDRAGNIWTSAGDGVHCLNSTGALIGKILIPETVANLCFGGEKMHRLFICGTTSLYAAHVLANGLR